MYNGGSDECFDLFKEQAEENHRLFTIIFPDIYPRNDQKCFNDLSENEFDELSEKEKEELKERYEEYSPSIKGNIVEFPLEFLSEEKMERPILSKERLIPMKFFM